jgi:formylglycine-generating enzyme required for sulfatase activity
MQSVYLTRRTILLAVAIALACGAAAYFYWHGRSVSAKTPHIVIQSDGRNAPLGMAWVPAGEFLMGSDSKKDQDNERPVHRVKLSGFWMDITHVTNNQFAQFIKETNYKTTAEQIPDWETIKVQLPSGVPQPPASVLVPGAMVFIGTKNKVRLDDYSQWWAFVLGANWKNPTGPKSNIDDKGNHPVVQVSYEDVQAYAKWIGKRLPTEAEWEFAARGGLNQATYVLGDQFEQNGKLPANIWDVKKRAFPVVNVQLVENTGIAEAGTTEVRTYPQNGYGLFDMAGNAWQWVADWYRADYFAIQVNEYGNRVIINPLGPSNSYDPTDADTPVNAPKRVIRGGSFLCNEDYCLSYRPSARRGSDPYNPMSHIGFRLVKDSPKP